jgi:hypothetical protein
MTTPTYNRALDTTNYIFNRIEVRQNQDRGAYFRDLFYDVMSKLDPDTWVTVVSKTTESDRDNPDAMWDFLHQRR